MSDDTILLTGASGHFGQYAHRELSSHACIHTLGRAKSNTYSFDLSQGVPQLSTTFSTVIHAAGKAHVVTRNSAEEHEIYRTNFEGTVNLTKALERTSNAPSRFVFISSVAVYGREHGEMLSEEESLIGTTAYAKSKISAEQHLSDWCTENGVKLTILRLPLLVGHAPPGNLGAMIKIMRLGLYFRSGDGSARRSMVLTKDVASFLLPVSKIGGTFNLTDGSNPSISEIENGLCEILRVKRPYKIPSALLALACKSGDILPWLPINSEKIAKLNSNLTFSDKRAQTLAAWRPRRVTAHLQEIL